MMDPITIEAAEDQALDPIEVWQWRDDPEFPPYVEVSQNGAAVLLDPVKVPDLIRALEGFVEGGKDAGHGN